MMSLLGSGFRWHMVLVSKHRAGSMNHLGIESFDSRLRISGRSNQPGKSPAQRDPCRCSCLRKYRSLMTVSTIDKRRVVDNIAVGNSQCCWRLNFLLALIKETRCLFYSNIHRNPSLQPCDCHSVTLCICTGTAPALQHGAASTAVSLSAIS